MRLMNERTGRSRIRDAVSRGPVTPAETDVVPDGAEPSGLASLRARLETGEPVGVADLLGMGIEAIEAGRVAFTCVTTDRFANPMGTVHGGILATLLDSALGCAAQTVLEDGSAYTTITLEVKYLRPVALDAGAVRAEGRVIHAGRRQITAEGAVTDAAGRVLATATSTCLVLAPRQQLFAGERRRHAS